MLSPLLNNRRAQAFYNDAIFYSSSKNKKKEKQEKDGTVEANRSSLEPGGRWNFIL